MEVEFSICSNTKQVLLFSVLWIILSVSDIQYINLSC